MLQTPVDFLSLFVRPPGDLLYFLAVIAISQAGFFMALGQRIRRPADQDAQRFAVATLGTVISWVLLMAGALYALLTSRDSTGVLPPLERAAGLVTTLLLGWAFLVTDNDRWRRLSNIVVLVFLALTIGGYILTGVQWASLTSRVDFNLSVFGVAWSFASVVVSTLGIVLTLVNFRHIVDAPLKMVFFLILLLGFGVTFYQSTQGKLIGDYAGSTRLAFLGALPIMPSVIYRMIIAGLQASAVRPIESPAIPVARRQTVEIPAVGVQQPSAGPSSVSPVERESVQLLRVLGVILQDSTPANIPTKIVNATLDAMKADIGAVLKVQDANYADVIAAYDKIMGRSISALAINLDNQPTLVNAIERKAQRPLFADRNTDEIRDFYTRLDINQVGPVYFQPLVRSGQLIAILAIGFPYSGRELFDYEEELLKGIGVIASHLLALSLAADDARLMAEERAIQAMIQGVSPDELEDAQVIVARQEMQASLELAREQIAQLTRQVMELKIQLDDERSRMATALGDSEEGLSISQRIVSLTDEQRRLREERDQLASRLQEAEAAFLGATTPDNRALVLRLIDGLQREKGDLLTERESLQAQIDDMRAKDKILMPQEVQTLVERMTKERSRLEAERDQLRSKLTTIQEELRALGLETDTSGLAQLISQLYEQRATLQARGDALKNERDTLLAERAGLEGNIERDKERSTRIETLQTELIQVAGDREAATRQREQFRAERDELVAKMEAIKQHRARLMAQAAGYEMELNEAHQAHAQVQVERQKLADERSDLLNERDRLLAEKQRLETERDQLIARLEGDRDRMQQVGEDGVGSLTNMIEELTDQRNQLERELNKTRTALSALEDQVEMLQVKASAASQIDTSAKYSPQNPELLLGLVQELRTPMTSVAGYVGLLLGESAGILGEMQRKFLQRVSVNVSRLASMLDDLVHITELDTGQFVLAPASVDVVGIIEDAITNASNQFREKGLTVHLSLEDSLPTLSADRDAITQIVGQLLTNAYLVSPPDSEIFITARQETVNLVQNGNNKPTDSLLVSVEDRGGGITPEDEARVFARKYKAENPLIQGLGDTGVGLSIAKALVEAHGGRLWLETREQVGSIFSFALPLEPALQGES